MVKNKTNLGSQFGFGWKTSRLFKNKVTIICTPITLFELLFMDPTMLITFVHCEVPVEYNTY